jgi:hypothetical protein
MTDPRRSNVSRFDGRGAPPPLVAGGQGRSAQQVQDDAVGCATACAWLVVLGLVAATLSRVVGCA